jgi:murein DD-endopeptidase MepM/ murein hydrolase activator NlpD
VLNGQSVSQGDPVALSGKTGASTAPHLHWTFKIMKTGVVQNKTNGYDGAMDCSEVTRLWQQQNVHLNAQYTDDAKPYLSMTFQPNQYIKNTTGA